MHEYPHVYTQIQNIYDKVKYPNWRRYKLAKIPKEILKDYTQNTRNYPKSIFKNVDEKIITFRDYTQNIQDKKVIPKIMWNKLPN